MATRGVRGLGGFVVGLVTLGCLLSTAGHANHAAADLASTSHQREANYSNAFYNCLDAEGHRLIQPNEVVWVAQDNLASWVEVTKAIGGWAHLTEHRVHASLAVLLEQDPRSSSQPNCQGQVLITIRQTRTGRILMSRAAPGQP
jgi:hypothetical protein